MHNVQDIIVELEQAWNQGDGARWAAGFADDAVFVDVLGRVQHGRDVIAEEHQKIFDTIYRGSRITIRQLANRSVGAGLHLVHTTSMLAVPGGPRAGETRAVQTKLVQDGVIRSFQNTVRAEMADFTDHDQDLADLSPLGWQQVETRPH